MGQCIYVAAGDQGPRVREIPSELWMSPAAAGEELAKGHLLNTTVGLWFYERDLWDKRELRRRLMALVDHVTSPEFLAHYEEFGRRQLRRR